MTLTEFFNLVLPTEGNYCFGAIKGKKIEHVFVESIEDLEAMYNVVGEGVNQYFTPATFAESGKRTQANSHKVRSFWLDIDVGKADANKCYPTKGEARTAIKTFLTDTGLPAPIWVDSGNGVHLYWPTTQDLDPEIWKPIAARLQALALQHNLRVDTSCTTDSARLLRFPGTVNYNDVDNPICGAIITKAYTAVDLLEFAKLLGLGDTSTSVDSDSSEMELGFAVPTDIKYADDGISKAMVGVTRFSIIMERSDSCAQLQYIKEHRVTIAEPMWRAGLSVAQICEDRENAVHELSVDYPGYNEAQALHKASQTNGPYTCQAFASIQSEQCEKCPHKGKITTPAQLGRYIEPAVTEADRTVEAPQVVVDNGLIVDTIVAPTAQVIPEYPSPYFRPKGGRGVYKTVKSPGEPDTTMQICEYDLYVTRRMADPDVGEVLWFRVHLPLDGIREFSVPLAEAVARDKLRDVLAKHGVMAVTANQVTEYLMYVNKWLRHLQMTKTAEKVRSQMGWTDEGSFVVGTREMIPNEPTGSDIVYAPAALRNSGIVRHLSEKGDFEKWKNVINFYANEDMEPYAFALFLSFGAPLMQFTTLRGGVYNLVSEESGIGKSSALLAANSIWGHPFDLLLQKDDTYNARIHRAGVMRHLPITIDEITNMKPTEVSDQMYASATGRGKNRMESHSNSERVNNTTFQTPTLTTSNSFVTDKLFATKNFPEGELMRIIEVEVHRNSKFPKAYTDMLFPQLEHNHGMAWIPYMRYVMNHQSEVISMLRRTQERTDAAASLTQRERIWSAMAAVAITGGTIAHNLGLHNINVEQVARWMAGHMFDNSRIITQTRNSAEDTIATYMSENYSNMLMIRNEPEAGTMEVIPIIEPRNELLIRYETDTRRIFIASGPFKKWCAKNQIGFNSLVKSLNMADIRTDQVKKRMAKGMALTMPPTNTLVLHIPENIAGSVFGLDEMDALDAKRKAESK